MDRIGQTISHYRILGRLGVGGMGVVYKAHDTKLDRMVALKFLPEHLTLTPEDQARFLQEARAASALNHPNICAIHALGEHEGQEFIDMEYVDGKTLRHHVPVRNLQDAVGYAIQIGEGLREAHSKGIVHRDIKTDNIMVNEKNQVKILDFGLAKLRGSLRLTRTSSTIGTLAYMAPEQIRGEEVDARSDIFSFGVVLFEMLTGHLPFRGEHEAGVMYSILNTEPESLQHYLPEAPPELGLIIIRALKKTPEERYQTINDMLIDLREGEPQPPTTVRFSTINKEPTPPELPTRRIEIRPTRRSMWLGFGLLAVVLVLAALYHFLFGSNPGLSLPSMKTIAFTSYPGYAGAPAFSPGGNSIAFVWNGEHEDNFDIYVKLIDAGSPLRLTNDPGDDGDPAWSPDGRYIAFARRVNEDASFYVVPSLGGEERKIGDVKSSLGGIRVFGTGIDWSPDGKSLVVSAADSPGVPNSISLLSIETGRKRRLSSPEMNGQGDFGPKYSPDGTVIAFLKSLSAGVVELYTIPSSGGKEKRLTFDNLIVRSASWLGDGREIMFSSNRGGNTTLWRIPSEGGSPTSVTGSGENVEEIAVAKDGTNVAYSRLATKLDIWQLNLGAPSSDRQPATMVISSRETQNGPRYSPDGKYIAFVSDRSGTSEIWVCSQDGTNPKQLTFFRGPQVGSPRWSPDGRFLLFDSRKEGNGNIYIMNSNGGPPRQVTSGRFENNVPTWSRDGRWIYFSSNRTGTFQIWKTSVDGGGEIQVSRNGGFVGFESSDGKYLYYAQKGNNSDIVRVPLAGGEEEPVDKRLTGLMWGNWKLTEKGIYYMKPDTNHKAHIYFLNFATQQADQIAITDKALYEYSGIEVSPDGRSMLYTQMDRIESDIMLIQHFH